MNNIRSALYKYERRGVLAGKRAKKSYAQCGEDLIIDFVLNAIGIQFPSYLDLGAHHPSYLNNTYIFYQRGCRGINVEANPNLMPDFFQKRKRDVNLNIGITDTPGNEALDFYIMTAPTMSTFSEAEARRLERESSIRISQVIKIPTVTLVDLVHQHAGDTFPDILTCDLEGLDEMVIESLKAFKQPQLPKIICLETATFREHGFGSKKTPLIEKVCAMGYTVHADTFINTIFCRQDVVN
ncbi:MAG: FkbM family methyltransferase [Aquabacterium sp.]|uniref:FkbM family methyltransferase n=1 Tax=Aquabacterium sp. TaxID=1872578 RepID=UPI0025C3E45B|nr:FkbM family methyltransferase [Aquabacterium sp.]MBI3382849.1 FkbM family methyltransferase [Aquabacterium sp.]